MSNKTNLTRSEQGQSMIEFAMTLVILLILLAGVVDFGRAFFTYMALRDAAQEGAVYGSIDPTNTSAIENRVRFNSSHPLDLTNTQDISVQITLLGPSCAGNGIQVDVTYENFPIAAPFLGAIIDSQTIPIQARVIDTILMPACH